MGKRVFMFAIMICMTMFFYGCAKTDNVSVSSQEETMQKDFPDGEYTDTGKGTMYISCAGGTSENGNIPIIFVSDEILIQVEIDTESFDGSQLSYVYIDGMLFSKEQLADSQLSLDLTEDFLKTGVHKLEVVQYDSGEPDGEIITYKTASYEIKEK